MANILLDYMSKRAEKFKIKKTETGPVITISRDYGCFATEIARQITIVLNENNKTNWKFITKEIFEESAKELNVNKQEIAHLFGANDKSFLGDLIVSFSKRKYASDSNIKEAISTIVKDYAENGNCIIVGRAGCVLANHIDKALHIKITAPFKYRVNYIMNKYNLTITEAEQKVTDTDFKRKRFMSFFNGDLPDNELFHITLNKDKLSEFEIVNTIINLAKYKGLI